MCERGWGAQREFKCKQSLLLKVWTHLKTGLKNKLRLGWTAYLDDIIMLISSKQFFILLSLFPCLAIFSALLISTVLFLLYVFLPFQTQLPLNLCPSFFSFLFVVSTGRQEMSLYCLLCMRLRLDGVWHGMVGILQKVLNYSIDRIPCYTQSI